MTPTAKEYLQNKYPSMKKHWNETAIDDNWVAQMMEDYSILKAKLHLTEFKNNIENELKSICNICMMSEEISTNLESILNAYNLDEIK